ncbi:MAG TPA: hypothetical protein VIT88_03745 [Pyrinomonadaceae bacterium]
MGWFSTDYLKLEILMHLNITARSGRGAIRWTPLAEHPKISQNQTRIALAALNYGRLVVNQRETRTDLFHRVSEAAERLAQGQKEFAVTSWSMKVGGIELPVWPWSIESPEQLTDGKLYVATLQGAKAGTFSVNLKMARGQELILTPVAALLPLCVLSKELDEQSSISLGKTLLQMNRYWRSPESATRIGSEVEAFKSALSVLVA